MKRIANLQGFSINSALIVIFIVFGAQRCECANQNATDETAITDSSPALRIGHFAAKINKFLYPSQEISARDTLIWSPLSVYSTLLTLTDAAGGQTYTELRELLDISSPLNNTLSGTSELLNLKEKTKLSKSALKIATGLFVDDNFKLKEGFLKQLRRNQEENGFYGKVDIISESMDPVHNSPEQLAFSVNQWINLTTDGLITEIIHPQNFNKNTKMVVVNGVQFKGKWKNEFKGAETEKRIFYGLKGPSRVKMMFQRSTQDYGRFETEDEKKLGFQVLKLAYRENGMKLVFILPDNSTQLPNIVKYLKSIQINEIMERLEPLELDIYIPKLKIESAVPIKGALQMAGLESLFSPLMANLTRMLALKNESDQVGNDAGSPISLHVDELVHKTMFEMYEEGTNAAAGTAGFLIPLSSLSHQSLNNFTINKPFIFFLKDEHATTIFQGVINDLQNDDNQVISSSSQSQVIDGTKELEVVSKINTVEVVDHDRDVSPWWIHKGTPEYLVDSQESISKPVIPKKAFRAKVNQSEPLKSFPRFQQPEPKHPEGIRFPFLVVTKNLTLGELGNQTNSVYDS